MFGRYTKSLSVMNKYYPRHSKTIANKYNGGAHGDVSVNHNWKVMK